MSSCPESCPELPAPPTRIVFFTALALLAGFGASILLWRSTGPKCTGYLTARSNLISSETDCILTSQTAREGDPVELGTPLYVVDNLSLRDAVVAQEKEIASLSAQLAKVEAEASLEVKWRLKSVEAEICELQLRTASLLKEKYDFDLQKTMLSEVLQQGAVAAVNEQGNFIRNVSSTSVVSPPADQPSRLSLVMQLENATNAAEVSAAQLEICHEREGSLASLRKDLPSQVQVMMGVDVAKEKLARAQSDLQRLQDRQQKLAVASPAIGRVGMYHARPGDHLKTGDPVVELIDHSKLYLTVHVPSGLITKFPAGTTVKLTFPGDEIRIGEVTQVALQALPPSHSTADATVIVQVEPRGKLWPDLPIGSAVQVQPTTRK